MADDGLTEVLLMSQGLPEDECIAGHHLFSGAQTVSKPSH